MKTNRTTLSAIIARLLTIILLATSVAFLSGCGDMVLDDIFTTDFTWDGNWNWTDNSPGLLYADSATYSEDFDSLTFYGHFSPYAPGAYKITEFGISVYRNDQLEAVPIDTNVTWNLTDTLTKQIRYKLHLLANDKITYFLFYYVYAKDSVNYQSTTFFIESPDYGVKVFHDSVSSIGNSKVVLFAHVYSKENCELTRLALLWGQVGNISNLHEFSVPIQLHPNESIFIADTISIVPNTTYEWHIFASAKLSKDRVQEIDYSLNTFKTGP